MKSLINADLANLNFIVYLLVVEIMISNTQKYNENLQHMRQVEIEQVHNFAAFRQQMESRYQQQIQSTIEQELELKAQQLAKQQKAAEERERAEERAAAAAEAAEAAHAHAATQRKSTSASRGGARQSSDAAPNQVNRRGRPPKFQNNAAAQ